MSRKKVIKLLKTNYEIRQAVHTAGLKLWHIAERLGLDDGNFSRRLRKELSAEEKTMILQIIDKLKEEMK
jgi:hypothetical protein